MESINQGENVFSCYIIFSMTLNKYYIGITSEGAQNRLIKHNTSVYGNSFTSKALDWKLCIEIPCDSNSMSRKTELYLKKMKSRKFLEKIINHPSELQKLIETIRSI